jgi:hypothetical protein
VPRAVCGLNRLNAPVLNLQLRNRAMLNKLHQRMLL